MLLKQPLHCDFKTFLLELWVPPRPLWHSVVGKASTRSDAAWRGCVCPDLLDYIGADRPTGHKLWLWLRSRIRVYRHYEWVLMFETIETYVFIFRWCSHFIGDPNVFKNTTFVWNFGEMCVTYLNLMEHCSHKISHPMISHHNTSLKSWNNRIFVILSDSVQTNENDKLKSTWEEIKEETSMWRSTVPPYWKKKRELF